MRTRQMSSVLLAFAVSGCVSTVDGTATRAAEEPAGQLSLLEERDLESILLDVEELNEILDSDEVEITYDLYETTDDSADTWSDCSADVVSLTDGADWFGWQLEDVQRDGGIVSQPSALADGDGRTRSPEFSYVGCRSAATRSRWSAG